MAYASAYPQGTPYSTGATVVRFAPIQDSEAGDDMLEPPFVRVRDGNTAQMYVDTSLATQFRGGFNDASWVVGQGGPYSRSNMDARKVRRMALTGVKYMWATPNVNPTNNTVIFRLSTAPLVDITAVIPTYNYMRMFTSFRSPVPTFPPTVLDYVWVTNPLSVPNNNIAYGNETDLEDGLISHLVTVMTAASGEAFTAIPSDGYRDTPATNYQNSNGIFWRLQTTTPGVTFIFTGGTLFTRGQTLAGVSPITPVDFTNVANYYVRYFGGPVSYLYTRWIDFTSRALCQNSKMPVSGTDVPVNLIARIYLNKELQVSGIKSVEINHTPLQWLNWRYSQAINSVDIQMRDEFGELVEVPQRQNNAGWASLVLLNEL
jgi:hypothetical protein